jgi:uncharacterized protein YkwD
MAKASLLLIALLTVTAVSLYPGVFPTTVQAFTGCSDGTTPLAYNATYEQTVIELVNTLRASNGNLPPLKRVEALDQVARYHAKDMGDDDYFDHKTFDRNSNNQLVEICEFYQRMVTYYSNYSGIGENIAFGQITPQEVVQGWMSSSGHRLNILSPYYSEIGVGYYPDMYGSYWVQDFGWRTGVYPLVINRESSVVQTRTVNLFIYGQNTWSEMRLRNDDRNWGNWQAFQSEVSWTLEQLPGMRTVWVELRQGAQTYTTSDTILYNPPPIISTENAVFLPLAIR